jgi:hypothetical protein
MSRNAALRETGQLSLGGPGCSVGLLREALRPRSSSGLHPLGERGIPARPLPFQQALYAPELGAVARAAEGRVAAHAADVGAAVRAGPERLAQLILAVSRSTAMRCL